MNKLENLIENTKKVEFEKNWTKVILEFGWWIWDIEKWVSLTWSTTKITIIKKDWKKITWLIDLWMFQWCEKEETYNEKIPFNLSKIDFSIVTHTHIDHIWKLLYLADDSFKWKIFTTDINKQVSIIMLRDIIKIQESKEENKQISKAKKIKDLIENIKKVSKHNIQDNIEYYLDELEEQLSNEETEEKDNEKKLIKIISKINSVWMYEKVEIKNDIQLSFIKAGHLPWSAQAILKIKVWKNNYITIWFSWDIWKFKNPAIWWEPDISKEKFDIFMIESTYAWRFHPEKEIEEKKLIEKIKKSINKKWKNIIPTFMQWRAQELIIYLNTLMKEWKIPKIDIYYHSQNIKDIAEIYERNMPDIFKWLNKLLKPAKTWKWKKMRNHFIQSKKSSILIASGWMIWWWTILNYLEEFENPKNLIISSWYQAESTLWDEIFNKNKEFIEINENKYIIRAEKHKIRTLSWHWDQNDLLQLISWMKFSKNAKVIINHWEKSPEQFLFWLAIKWIVWKTKEVLIAEFNPKLYK